MSERYYTTASTVPDFVRPAVWKDWTLWWNRTRRRWKRDGYGWKDRDLEWRSGQVLTIEGTEFTIRWSGNGCKFHIGLKDLAFHDVEVKICGSVSGKPYLYASELQEAIDFLTVQSVMEENDQTRLVQY